MDRFEQGKDSGLFEELPWDSAFFGFPAARILAPTLDGSRLDAVLEALADRGIRLAYWTHDPADAAANAAASACGGFLADVKLTYVAGLPAAERLPSFQRVEPARKPFDMAALRSLAILAGTHSRFRVDPDFPEPVFRALYGEWMRKSLAGEMADVVLTADAEGDGTAPGGIAGMITAKADGDTGSIGLVAVDPRHQLKGYGTSLIMSALDWFADRGCARVRVVTQERNESACRHYARCGFRQERREHTWHFRPKRRDRDGS